MRSVRVVLRGRGGASLMFVLAAMLLLMAIGVSALAAAGANRGAGRAKARENQLLLYLNSMELSIAAALKEETETMTPMIFLDGVGDDSCLTAQILKHVYGNVKAGGNSVFRFEFETDPGTTDVFKDWGVAYTDIVISGNLGDYKFIPCKPAVWEDIYDDDGIFVDRELVDKREWQKFYLFSASKPGKITVEIKVTLEPQTSRDAPLTVMSVTTYDYKDYMIEEYDTDPQSDAPVSDMYIKSLGVWEVSRHERVDPW